MSKTFLFCFLFFSTILYAREGARDIFLSKNSVETPNKITSTPLILEGPITSSYHLGPGDFLEISVEDFTRIVQVSPEGAVSLNEKGLLNVQGMLLDSAKSKILDLYQNYCSTSQCFVQLVRPKNFVVPITGGVNNPNTFHANGGNRLGFLIKSAGGFSPSAILDSILIINNNDTTRINYLLFEKDGKQIHNPIIHQGDQIFIPQIDISEPLVIYREDNYLRLLAYQKDQTLADYLQKAGRLKNIFNLSSFRLTHEKQSKIIPFSKINSTKLSPGTQIEVLSSKSSIFIGGAVLRQGPMPYNPNYRPIDYLVAAGITPITGDIKLVRRIRADKTDEWIDSETGIVKPGDYLELPKSTFENVKELVFFISSIATIAWTIVLIQSQIQTTK